MIPIAILPPGQSCPKPGHEKALRAVLRIYVVAHKDVPEVPLTGLENLSEKDIGPVVACDPVHCFCVLNKKRGHK